MEEVHRYEYVTEGHPEQGVQSEPAPLSIVEGCKYDFSVIAAIIAMKFAFHVPTYRQQDWFAQCGSFPSRSTVNDLINYSVDTVEALPSRCGRCCLSPRSCWVTTRGFGYCCAMHPRRGTGAARKTGDVWKRQRDGRTAAHRSSRFGNQLRMAVQRT